MKRYTQKGKNAKKQIEKMRNNGYKVFLKQDFGVFQTIDWYQKFDFDFSDHKLMIIYPDGTWKMS